MNRLLFEGKLSDTVFIGANLSKNANRNLRKWQDQEGDIPAAYQYSYKGLRFEIYGYNEIIWRISVKFYHEPDCEFIIQNTEGLEQAISVRTPLIKLIDFLNVSKIVWRIDNIDSGDKSLGLIIANMAQVMYSFEPEELGFYQISVIAVR